MKRWGPYLHKQTGYLYYTVKFASGRVRKVQAHREVMEKHLGRRLRRNEVVHHENEDKTDNRVANLKVLTRSRHAVEHAKDRTTTFVSLTCACCGKSFQRRKGQEPEPKGYQQAFCGRRCAGKINGPKGGGRSNEEFCHGTPSAYSYRGCRCSVCRAAHAERLRKYRSP